MLRRVVMICGIMGILSCGALADGQQYDRRFARISYMEGHVVFRHDSDTDWSAGSINTPLQEQDRIYVPPNSRAEIEFDDGSFLRLAEDTEIRILSLAQDQIRVEQAIGLTTVRFSSHIQFELDSPAASVHLLQRGVYRLEVQRDGSLDVAVRKGTAEVAHPGKTERVRRREAIYVPIDRADEASLRPIDAEDSWDQWNDRRDASVVASSSRRYIPSNIGTYELDQSGSWVYAGNYGYGWSPSNVGDGWSPYRDGRWTYRPYWGWTWVSYESWGWLPYHYGSWYYHPTYSWLWLPYSGFGYSYGFHYWSPGLVHFYGYGGGYHWLPLGPHDLYVANNYFYNTHNVSDRNHFNHVVDGRLEHLPRDRQLENLAAPGALVSVGEKEFLTGQRVRQRRIPTKEIISSGNSFDSVRDLRLRPTAKSRSPHPELEVARLGLVDLRKNSSRSGSGSRDIQRTVKTQSPGRVTNETRRIFGRDIGRTKGSARSETAVRTTLGGRTIPSGPRRIGPTSSRDRVVGDHGRGGGAAPVKQIGRVPGTERRGGRPSQKGSDSHPQISHRDNRGVKLGNRVVTGGNRPGKAGASVEVRGRGRRVAGPGRRVVPDTSQRRYRPPVRTFNPSTSRKNSSSRYAPSTYRSPRVRVINPSRSSRRNTSPQLRGGSSRRGNSRIGRSRSISPRARSSSTRSFRSGRSFGRPSRASTLSRSTRIPSRRGSSARRPSHRP